MDLFFSDSLYNTKIFLVSSILTIIFFLLLLTRKIYKKKLTVSNLSIYSSLFLLLITIASLLVVNFFGKFTYVLFIAATITVIYSEISFLLGKYFFPNFVGENISKEIIYMFSFIVFINVGYFTFMLILDILKAETVLWMKIITLEVGNTSWWKNRKYRREASLELKKLRKNYKSIRLVKKYRLDGSNTIIYADYHLIH